MFHRWRELVFQQRHTRGSAEQSGRGHDRVHVQRPLTERFLAQVDTREAQAKEMKAFVEKTMRSSAFVGSSNATIDVAVMCGDLNIIAGSAEYEKIMETLSGDRKRFAIRFRSTTIMIL